MSDQKTKVCTVCQAELPLDDYYVHSGKVRYGCCKKCHYQRTKKHSSKYIRDRYREDPEFRQKMKDRAAAWAKERYANDPEFRKAWNEYVKKKYHDKKKESGTTE